MKLIVHGSISSNFALFARLVKIVEKIESGAIRQSGRIDCFELPTIEYQEICFILKNKFQIQPSDIEIFFPSMNYPSHKDEIGTSYFIPLENGIFTIDDMSHPVVPFVLYSFDDSNLHNSDFPSIMIR
jgi:hypothetical protein